MLPQRQKLPHSHPAMVADGTCFFITQCCEPKGHNQLALPAIASAIGESLLHYQNAGKWWVHLVVLMPDHVHGLFSFPREIPSMRKLFFDWKRYLARQHGIKWQRDFFEHRIRDAALLEKEWHYIRMNPVRRNFVEKPEDWPYQWGYGGEKSPKYASLW